MDDTDLADTVIRPRMAERSVALPPVDVHASNLRREIDADTVVRVPGRMSPEPTQSTHEYPADVEPVPAVSTVHRFSLNGGEPFVLDAPYLIGRKPRVPRVISGIRPHLVTVESARGEVSATHLDISGVGASVVITDLRSTNGTVVTMPGALPVTMRSGESLVAVAGTTIDIGDGNMIEVLSPPRLRPWDRQESDR